MKCKSVEHALSGLCSGSDSFKIRCCSSKIEMDDQPLICLNRKITVECATHFFASLITQTIPYAVVHS